MSWVTELAKRENWTGSRAVPSRAHANIKKSEAKYQKQPTILASHHHTYLNHVHPKSAKSQSRSYDGKPLSCLLDQYHQMTVIMAWI
jgi:hypothetical protein